jgi:hypothetical protein
MDMDHPDVSSLSELAKPRFGIRDVPWQLWVVIVLLSVEAIGNLLLIPRTPIAALWLGAQLLFVWGFIRRWRVAYVLFCISTALHVLAFSRSAPFVSFLNLVTLILAISQHRLFFPAQSAASVSHAGPMT